MGSEGSQGPFRVLLNPEETPVGSRSGRGTGTRRKMEEDLSGRKDVPHGGKGGEEDRGRGSDSVSPVFL